MVKKNTRIKIQVVGFMRKNELLMRTLCMRKFAGVKLNSLCNGKVNCR